MLPIKLGVGLARAVNWFDLSPWAEFNFLSNLSLPSSLISLLIFSSVKNCISSSLLRDSVNSTPVSCCFRGFFLGDISTVVLMVIRDCSGSSSRPGEDVADTVVDPELWHPPPSRSPRGEPGGLDVETTAGIDTSTGVKFLATPCKQINEFNKSQWDQWYGFALIITFRWGTVVISFSQNAWPWRCIGFIVRLFVALINDKPHRLHCSLTVLRITCKNTHYYIKCTWNFFFKCNYVKDFKCGNSKVIKITNKRQEVQVTMEAITRLKLP